MKFFLNKSLQIISRSLTRMIKWIDLECCSFDCSVEGEGEGEEEERWTVVNNDVVNNERRGAKNDGGIICVEHEFSSNLINKWQWLQ